MTPAEALREAESDALRPVYLVVGEEAFLADRVVRALSEATGRGGLDGFNVDRFTAGEASADVIVAAANMLPMMAKRRFVLVRGLDRWESQAERAETRGKPKTDGKKPPAAPLDVLAAYAEAPADTAVVVLVASKLNGSRKLVKAAKAGGYLVECQTMKRNDEIASWIEGAARARGHAIDGGAAMKIAELAGPDLGSVDDAVERLGLYVGPEQRIDSDAVERCVARVREASVWDLIDAIVDRRLDRALTSLADVVDARDTALPALGAIASNVRQLLKLDAALREGASVPDAAQAAGIVPFKAQKRAQALRRLPPRSLSSWPRLLAAADGDLKGSRKEPAAVLEELVIAMCSDVA